MACDEPHNSDHFNLREKNTGPHLDVDGAMLMTPWWNVIHGCIFYPFIPTVFVYSHKNVD